MKKLKGNNIFAKDLFANIFASLPEYEKQKLVEYANKYKMRKNVLL